MAQQTLTTIMVLMIEAVKAYAYEHYEQGAWDTIVECWADDEIAEVIREAQAVTAHDAIEAVRKEIAPFAGYRDEIQNTAF